MEKFTIRNEDGTINFDASAEAFRAALVAQAAEGEKLGADIETAVDAVFDEKGARLPKQMLIDGVLAKLGRTPENHSTLTRAVEDYLRRNTSKDKGVDGRRIAALKGQKGGLQRLALPGQPVTALVSETTESK